MIQKILRWVYRYRLVLVVFHADDPSLRQAGSNLRLHSTPSSTQGLRSQTVISPVEPFERILFIDLSGDFLNPSLEVGGRGRGVDRGPLFLWLLSSWFYRHREVALRESLLQFNTILSNSFSRPRILTDTRPSFSLQTWSSLYRWYLTGLAGFLVLNSTFTSSSPSGIITPMSAELGLSSEVATLTISMFLLGYCVGKLLN